MVGRCLHVFLRALHVAGRPEPLARLLNRPLYRGWPVSHRRPGPDWLQSALAQHAPQPLKDSRALSTSRNSKEPTA